jgi:transcription-repair coupling factor (superfamily II helicase)
MTLTLPSQSAYIHYYPHLPGAALAHEIARLVETDPNLTLIITENQQTAQQLEREIGLFFENKQPTILHFPDWETLPYDVFSPHQDIISQRLSTLYQLGQKPQGVVIVPISTLMHRVAPAAFLAGHVFLLKAGDTLDIEQTRIHLERNGYQCVGQVVGHGEFAVRGSILDIYPMGSKRPYRIELFDDEVETIRQFDPDTQRSDNKIDAIELLPAKEFPLDETGVEQFSQSWRDHFSQGIGAESIYHDVRKKALPAGIEYYLPLFFEETATLFDYLPSQTKVITHGKVQEAGERFWQEAQQRYEQKSYDVVRPPLRPAKLFCPIDEVNQHLKQYPRIQLLAETESHPNQQAHAFRPLPDIAINHRSEQPLQSLAQLMKDTGYSALICADSTGRREVIADLLKSNHQKAQLVSDWKAFVGTSSTATSTGLQYTTLPIDKGFVDDENKRICIAESDLYGQRVLQRRRRKKHTVDSDSIVRDLSELKLGEPVVHIDHGIGKYQGLKTLDVGENPTEFLTLQYANDSLLYVPVASLHLISRYTGADKDKISLHRLGSDQWEKAKRKAAEKVRDVAADLLDLYARREAKLGAKHEVSSSEYRQFSASFPFEETVDQEGAIRSVEADMASPQPMDRLVCGDVGFGKTEVAMRAAFIAVENGNQVGVLVPTTLLAEQHFKNFQDRFADWPFKIASLSRFKTTKEQNQVLKELNEGKVDIVIGTHKLLQKDIKFSDLGLLIIDEEHRFGVRQKEQLKKLRTEVDILTLTATPIPRTLNMALSGMRDLSIIATPPAKRLAIKTFVNEKKDPLIRESILREILRGGQVYFLHNEVKSIERMAENLTELVPEAKVRVAHGQMRESELERIMTDFYHQRFNVLVCTTIIETGIDVPTANTIIMNNANELGLAQLHQLRGRVGRSHHQAYAYLLTPPPKQLTKDAAKRLEAISSLEDLGAGFSLATHDLEIRGAGEILGEDQSGQMEKIGFSLYMEMLDQAVEALKSGKEPSLAALKSQHTEVDLHIPALINDDYLPDINQRLSLYKRIASAEDDDSLDALRIEIIDRFGLMPEAAQNLFSVTRLRNIATSLGITKIDTNAKQAKVEFSESTPIEPIVIIQLIQSYPSEYQLQGASVLIYKKETLPSERVTMVEQLLQRLKNTG